MNAKNESKTDEKETSIWNIQKNSITIFFTITLTNKKQITNIFLYSRLDLLYARKLV